MFRVKQLPFSLRSLLLLSAALAVLWPTAAHAQKTAGKRVALLVGINKYEKRGFRDLEFAEQDVTELADVLRKMGYTVHLLTGEKATLAEINAKTKQAVKGLTKDDLLMVGLAGHGFQLEAADRNGDARTDSYYCPYDAVRGDAKTMSSIGDLFEFLDQRGAGQNVVFVDACREDPTRGRGLDGSTVRGLPLGTAVLFGCQAGQKSYESAKAGKGHGVFFHFVIEGMKGKAKNTRGEVTWSRLADYVIENVETEAPALIGADDVRQTPNLVANLPGRAPVLGREIVEGDAKASFDRAEAARSAGDNATAIRQYTQAIEIDPNMEDAYFWRGRLYREQGEYAKALFDIDQAIRIDPQDNFNYWDRSFCFTGQQKYADALPDLEQSIRLDPTFVKAFTQQGYIYTELQRWDDAVQSYSEAVRLEPKNAENHRNLGYSRQSGGDPAGALVDLNEAIRLNAADPLSHRRRGLIQHELGAYDEALKNFDEAIRLDADYEIAFYDRADTHRMKRDYERALADMNTAIRLSPNDALNYRRRSQIWSDKKEVDSAIADLTKALEVRPQYDVAFHERALRWIDKKQYDKAIDDSSEAIRIDPKFAAAYNARASAHVYLQKFELAKADYQSAIKASPQSPVYKSHYAWMLATCSDANVRDGRQAVTLAEEAAEISEWKNADILDTLAAAYAEAGDFKQAIKYQTIVVGLAPAAEKANYQTRLDGYKAKKPWRSL